MNFLRAVIMVLVSTVVIAKPTIRRTKQQAVYHRSGSGLASALQNIADSQQFARLVAHMFKMKDCRRIRWNPLF